MTSIAVDAVANRSSFNDVACSHCGLSVPKGAVVDNAEYQFCCSGCHSVFSILHQHGLDSYYSFAERKNKAVKASSRSYEEFDHPAFRELYVSATGNGVSRVELYLEGVHCSSCVWLVERIPLLLNGVVRSELDVRRSLAVIEWSEESLSLSSIARQLSELGYPPHPFRGIARNAVRKREDRAMLVRIGVAGAIAINVMLAALALYAGEVNGMEKDYERLFRWISFAVTVPAFIWPGRVFFTGAWAALRTRTLHMDLPIAIALAAGLVRGAINTITDSGPVYFDGLAILIFALLTGRFLQQRGQRMANDSAELLHALTPSTARVVDGDEVDSPSREIPAEAILPGMVLDVRAGESFAADGIVLNGRSSVNVALLTGESLPVTVSTGDLVYAGTTNVEAPLRITVSEAGERSRLSQILQQVEAGAARKVPVVLLANRLAGIFVAVVLALAVATFAIRYVIAPEHALDDAIALLIVTCPCALALATPLAITVSVGRAAQRGILIKGGDSLELLSKAGTIVLDKTGTITEGHVALVQWLGEEWAKPLVLSLEYGSSHPIADGFRRAWPSETVSEVINPYHETGGGLQGTVNGKLVRVGSSKFVLSEAVDSNDIMSRFLPYAETLTAVVVAVDGEVVAVAGMGDNVRPDAHAALNALRERGWNTVLLSGDSQSVAMSVGKALGFATENIIGGATPEQKLGFVEQARARGTVVMVGDGVNDAAAIAVASVGIGVHGGAEACLSTADIYLATPGLSPLMELITGAERTMRVIRRNILFSLTYNVVGAGMAMIGVLTPLIAAILMPASSITVVLASWYSRTFDKERQS